MQESIVFLVRVQCRRKESSRSLSHLLMSFLPSYRAVFVKLSPLTKGCLSLTYSFSVISLNIAINHILPKLDFWVTFCFKQYGITSTSLT